MPRSISSLSHHICQLPRFLFFYLSVVTPVWLCGFHRSKCPLHITINRWNEYTGQSSNFSSHLPLPFETLSTPMPGTTDFFSFYERFLSLCLTRLTFVSLKSSYKPSLSPYIIELIDQNVTVSNCFVNLIIPISFSRSVNTQGLSDVNFLHTRKNYSIVIVNH